MPENNAMRTPLSKEISPMEITFDKMYACIDMGETANVWGIERSGFFNGREKWAKGFENQRV